MNIFMIILAFTAGFSLCLIVTAWVFSQNPDGYFLINQKDAEDEFIKMQLDISMSELVEKNFVILKVKNR